MAVSLIPILIITAAAVAAILGVVALSRRQNRRRAEVEDPTTPTLRYRVPEGQDPLAVLTAVRQAGYEVVTEDDLVVVRAGEEQRESVRATIEGAGINVENPTPPGHPVRFVDE